MIRTTDGIAWRGRRRASTRRSAFTLVELLTVIAIIGMLSAISISTVRVAIQSAKETQTRTTIAKIDSVLTACYEKYQYRRVDLSDQVQRNRWADSPEATARYRLYVLRDLLRCDFPCTLEELETVSAFNKSSASDYTPLQEAIKLEVSGSKNGILGADPDEYVDGDDSDFPFSYNSYASHIANAELLYLVVMNADPEARASFSEREIGDVDGNGLFEFIDGWGNPICWMRWAPGLEWSDRQPILEDVLLTSGLRNDRGSIDARDFDPLDPLDVGIPHPDNNSIQVCGWFLAPYVFSAGPDGKYGLVMPTPQDVNEMNCPFLATGNSPWYGSPVYYGAPFPGSKAYKDNIDNHTLVR